MGRGSPDPAGPRTTGANAQPGGAAGRSPVPRPSPFVLGVPGTPPPPPPPRGAPHPGLDRDGDRAPSGCALFRDPAGSALGLSSAAAAVAAAAPRAQPTPPAPGAPETEAGEPRASRAAAAVPMATGGGAAAGGRRLRRERCAGSRPRPGLRENRAPTPRRLGDPGRGEPQHPGPRPPHPRSIQAAQPDFRTFPAILCDGPLDQTSCGGGSQCLQKSLLSALQLLQLWGPQPPETPAGLLKSSLALVSRPPHHRGSRVLTRQGCSSRAAVPSVTLPTSLRPPGQLPPPHHQSQLPPPRSSQVTDTSDDPSCSPALWSFILSKYQAYIQGNKGTVKKQSQNGLAEVASGPL